MGLFSSLIGDPLKALKNTKLKLPTLNNNVPSNPYGSPYEVSKPKNENDDFTSYNDFDAVQNKKPNGTMNEYERYMMLNFEVPDWGIKNYIRERTSWQKQLESFTGEPGWFYFKIFFKFNTNYGLFGGVMTDATEASSNTFSHVNTALQFIYNNVDRLPYEDLMDRALALGKFTCLLSFISGRAPWFFKGISGLDKAYSYSLNDFSKQKELEIEVMEDAVDMRLTTLFDLYKYACFDFVNYKEIVPENLRKFDMTVVLYHTPLRYYHTGSMFENGTVEYKTLNDAGNQSNRMSFKMFTFNNCEFDLESLGAMMPNEMQNDTPFNLGKSRIKIKYDRVYQHNMNEWNMTMFGDDGFYWNASKSYDPNIDDEGYRHNNQKNIQQQRLLGIINAWHNKYYYNRTAQFYKAMVDASEAIIGDNMRTISPKDAFGNLYGDYDVGSDYFKKKVHDMKHGTLPSNSTSGNRRRR